MKMNVSVQVSGEDHIRNIELLGFRPHGLTVIQSWEQIGLYLRAIDLYGVDLFVEIGMAWGGLQQFITPRTKFVPEFNYIGTELQASTAPKQNWQRGVYMNMGDHFGAGFSEILHRAIAASRVTFLFCDGGNKPKEIGYFHKFLRVGDYICTHDFTDEVQEEDLDCLRSDWEEVEPELYRAALIPLFRRVAA